jgi:hypothetical protein
VPIFVGGQGQFTDSSGLLPALEKKVGDGSEGNGGGENKRFTDLKRNGFGLNSSRAQAEPHIFDYRCYSIVAMEISELGFLWSSRAETGAQFKRKIISEKCSMKCRKYFYI